MTREKGLETIIVLVLASIFIYWKFDVHWLIYLAFALLVIAVISKQLTEIIGKLWFLFSHYFGMLMNYIIMFLIFYIVLTPLSFFQRLANKNQILKRGVENTHFHTRNHIYNVKDIEKPW